MSLHDMPRTPISERTSIDRLTRLYEIVRSLNSIIHLDQLLSQIVVSAAEMIDAQAGAIMLADESGENLIFEVASGKASPMLKGLVIPINGRSVAGMVAQTGQPYIENDAQHSAHFSGQVDRETGYRTGKLICVPLKVQERVTGVVEVLDKNTGEDFDSEDVKLLEALADVAAVAIENVSLYEETQQRARQLAQAYEELQRTYQGTLQALMGLLDSRDAATHGHSNRVVAFTLVLAEALGITDPERLKIIEQGALLHDVGKIGVPDAVLNKAGPLNELEWQEMRAHPELGYRMLKDIEFLKEALPIVRHHHEHWDGNGYPLKLRGSDIPLEARIFAVADAFDAVTSERPYSVARTYEQASAILRSESGKTFDPAVVEAFLKVPPEVWQEIRKKAAAE